MQKHHSTKFNFKSFIQLINQIHPRYWQLICGFLLGVLATGMQLAVPMLAKTIINSIGHAINHGLVIGVTGLFIASTIIGAVSGSILGFFGEDVVYKLRARLWQKKF